jgi:hypothetical protein
MTKHFLIFIFSFFVITSQLKAQINIKDSSLFIPTINASFSYQIPGGDMADRFGNSSMVGVSVLMKDKKNFLYGVGGHFIFGNNVVEDNILDGLKNSSGFIIDKDGQRGEVYLFQRGFKIDVQVGKLFSVLGHNKNSGIYVLGGVGLLQHKIKIDDVLRKVPQVTGDYKKGYDRLSNGLSLMESVGYRYLSNKRLINFYVGLEFIQAFTENRRSYNFDTMMKDDKKRVDLLSGIVCGWTIPIYKKTPKEFYYY